MRIVCGKRVEATYLLILLHRIVLPKLLSQSQMYPRDKNDLKLSLVFELFLPRTRLPHVPYCMSPTV